MKQEVRISGKVMHGDGYGKVLGFPTANIDRRDYIRKRLKVRFGVWAGTAEILNSFDKKSQKSKSKPSKICRAAIVIGPLDRKGLPKLEAHLINFHGNLYGKRLALHFHKFIRPYKKFKNVDGLKSQIAADVRIIKKLH